MSFPVRGFLLAALVGLMGCSSAAPNRSVDQAATEKLDVAQAAAFAQAKETDDLQRLTRLWQERRQESSTGDYPIGPGDVIDVSVPGMEELKDVSVRVTGEGKLSLPFVGVINVTGMTDKGLRDEIRKRLQKNIMRDPQVDLFVKEFRSRQVAVIGAVQKPGLYNLTNYSDTIFSMISQAGGMIQGSAERILFIPAEPADPDKAKEVVASLPVRMTSQDPSPLILKNVEPIVINLGSVIRGGNEKYLSIPARPGDIIMVPGAGEVLVQGWVEKPGSYKITPGLTILGAVAAAGGPMYPADTSAVEITRTNRQGKKISMVADLSAIKSGQQPDIPVLEGDVVNLSSSGPKMVAYGIYSFFTSVMHVGASVPVR